MVVPRTEPSTERVKLRWLRLVWSDDVLQIDPRMLKFSIFNWVDVSVVQDLEMLNILTVSPWMEVSLIIPYAADAEYARIRMIATMNFQPPIRGRL